MSAFAEKQIVKHDAKSILEAFQAWQGIYWQSFQSHQIDIQLDLSLIITESIHYLKIFNWTQQLKVICLIY